MPNLSIRGVEEDALQRIRAAAKQRRVSVNAYLVELIRRDAGLAPASSRHHDLDALAGTWSDADASEFGVSQRDFGLVDPALWPDARVDGDAPH